MKIFSWTFYDLFREIHLHYKRTIPFLIRLSLRENFQYFEIIVIVNRTNDIAGHETNDSIYIYIYIYKQNNDGMSFDLWVTS